MSLLWPLHFAAAASLVVKVYPERVLSSQGGPVTLRCQVSGSPPHYFYWSREDGRPISSSADRRRQGKAHTSTTAPQLVWDRQIVDQRMPKYLIEVCFMQSCYAWVRHLLLICVCRSRAVLPQRPAERCRRLRLYLQRPAQHQPEPCWNRCHKCVWSHWHISKCFFSSRCLLQHTK